MILSVGSLVAIRLRCRGGLLVVVCCWNGLICLAVLMGSVVSLFIAARDQQLDCGDTYGPAKSKIIKAQGR